MKKIIVKNTIEKDLNLNYKGNDFFIPALGSEEFEPEVAQHWVTIYGFLEVGEAKEEVEEEKKTKKTAKKSK